MSTRLTRLGAAALIALASAHVAVGQESVERDPFSAPDIGEVVRAADRDRVSRITNELVEAQLAAIEERIILEVERRLSALLDRRLTEFGTTLDERVEGRLTEMSGVVSALRDEVPAEIQKAIAERVAAGSSDAAALGLLPEGSAFVACVDGRALYRDGNGSTFYMDSPTGGGGVSRCSN